MKILTFYILTILAITACNFEEASEESGGGLFSGHKEVSNEFLHYPPADRTYIEDDNIDLVFTHPSNIVVTGTPRIELVLDSGSVYATYLKGSGSKTLVFRYTVQSGDEDSDGLELGSTLDLNGGSLKFSNAGLVIDAELNFEINSSSDLLVDTTAPSLSLITPPTPTTYLLNQSIQFLAIFDDTVTVSGTPRLALDIGGNTVYADYQSGDKTTTLIFRYFVQSSDIDMDGIEMSSPLELNGGSITDVNGNASSLTFVAIPMPTTFVDGETPLVTAMNIPSAVTYLSGEFLELELTYNQNVDVTGLPRVAVDIGGATQYLTYSEGTGTKVLKFDYLIAPGDDDTDGVSIDSSIDLDGGTIQNSSGTDASLSIAPPLTPTVLVDAGYPTVQSIIPPSDATYDLGDEFYFTLIFDKNVTITGTPRIAIETTSSSPSFVYADYISGSGTKNIVFRYVVQNVDYDLDGIELQNNIDLNSGTIVGANTIDADLDMSSAVAATTTTGILIDAVSPKITSVTPPPNNTYVLSNDLDFVVNTNQVINVVGTPRIQIDIGGTTKYADYTSGTGTNALTFRYSVEAGLYDNDGISITSPIDLNSGTLLNGTSVPLDLTFTSPSLSGVLVDSQVPEVSSVTAPSNGYYLETQNLDFTVNLAKAVNVTGTPRIQIDINGSTKYANYLSGDGTATLIFRYTVTNTDEDNDGIQFASTSIDLNSGTIEDLVGNALNLDMGLNTAVPSLASVFVDGVIPTVSITYSPDITSANELTYLISGTCSEEGRTVNIDLGGMALTSTCSSNSWATSVTDVSGLADNPAIAITADLSDAAGNNATQAATTVSKDTTTPTVAITNANDIDISNHTAYSVSGTCTENATIVDVYIGSINVQPNCSGGTWTTGNLDVSSLADNPSLSITADHSTAVQASTTVDKDITSSVVTISSAVNITGANETSYVVSGTCSDNGVTVTVNISSLNYTPNCNSGSWTTGLVDVSSLADSASILVTADHATANQASATISKNTATPTVSSLSSPTTLTNSVDLNWSLNDPGGFTIDDYEINYRIKNTPTWLGFSDGISTDTSGTVTGLTASTSYEFRVRVQYDTSNYSDWSSTTEAETKPDDPLFSSPYAAMNVGGATSTSVVAYYDNTVVTLNGTPIPDSPLSKGQTSVIATAQFDVIDGDKPIFAAGILGSGNGGNGANMVWMPTSWAGKSFSFNATRANPQNLFVFATENATITVKQGSTTLDTITLAAGNGGTLNWSVYGSYQVTSTGTILAYHMSGSGTTRYDPKPILPGYTEIIGFASASMRLTADLDSTNYNVLHGNSVTASGNLNKQDVVQINSQGTSSLYQGFAVKISADRKISGASFADSNGLCAAPFLPTNLLKTRYVINADANYVAFASKQAGTIDVYTSAQTIGVDPPLETLTLTRSGADPNAPYNVRRGTTSSAGYRFVSTVPVAAWYHPSVEVGSAANDETVLYGTND